MHDNIKKKISDELDKQNVKNIDLNVALQMVNNIKDWEQDEDEDLNDDYGRYFTFTLTNIS